ncbi:hypothetical protein ABGF48_05220 [Helcococcus bovis]|uniref:hypothetical protein n=1 Tax=Helcococcus bovis TaxID=3153252 RepID=UPI0038BBB180
MRKNLVLLIALTLSLTACSTKTKETVKETKKEIKLETIKETKKEIKQAPLLSNFKVIKKDKKEYILADIKNDKDKIKTLKVLESFKIPFTKQKESVEFLRGLWDLKYKKEIVEKIEKEINSLKDTKKIKEIAKKEEKKSNESKNLVKDEKELAQKSETQKENIKITKKEEPKVTQKETSKPQKTKQKEKVWVVDVKKQDPVYENKCVLTKQAWTETTDELIDFDQIIKPRWFVNSDKYGKEYYYNEKEAYNRYGNLLKEKDVRSSWGTAEDEVIITNKKYKTINHSEEKSCKKVLIKEGVKEKGHWEYR